MRVVYNTDARGSPINKIGALQFLYSRQGENIDQHIEEDKVESILRGNGAYPSMLNCQQQFEWSNIQPHTPTPQMVACSMTTLCPPNNYFDARNDRNPVTRKCDTALLSPSDQPLFGCFLDNCDVLAPSPKLKKQRRSFQSDHDVSGPSTPSKTSGSARGSSILEFSPPRSPSDLDTNVSRFPSHIATYEPDPLPIAMGMTQVTFQDEFCFAKQGRCSDIQIAHDGGEPIDLQGLAAKLMTVSGSSHEPGVPLDDTELSSTEVHFSEEPVGLHQGVDIAEQPCWGFDCCTYKNILSALAMCSGSQPKHTPNSEDFASERRAFIERRLLPAIQQSGSSGWNLLAVIEKMQLRAAASGNDNESNICCMLASTISGMASQEKRCRSTGFIRDSPASYFKIHPKGTGVVCMRNGGIPAGTYVASFQGEAYTPWRWFEKQEMLRRRHGSLTAADQCMAVPLQRPRHADSLGYDLIYIDSSSCSGIGSRIAHSCNPNCMAKTMCAAGKISMGIFTTRHVVEGEELTWDHACFTEMEQESRNATCLCGTSACRGSLLYYVNSRSFQEVLSKQHTFLDRTAMLLVSCTESLSTDDEQRLEDYGVSRSVLVDDPCGEGLPVPWMKKWASLLIRYIDYEAEMLPNLLMSKHGASTGRATVESSAIHANRMQNLAATLDKAKYFLRKQPDDCQLPPLRMLSDNEVIEHLWTGPMSIARRFVAACSGGLQHNMAGGAALQKLKDLLGRMPSTTADCQHLLRELASVMGSIGPSHYAAHDCALLYATTEHFFEPAKYQAVSTTLLEAMPGSGDVFVAMRAPTNEKRNIDMETSCKKYRPGFLWGQMSAWFKQTVRDPSASLSADRRGTVSLPDPECCFGKDASGGKYSAKERRALILHIENTPSVMWPLQTIWSFKNPSKVYGSPMLDVAIHEVRGDEMPSFRFDALLQELKNTL